MTPEALYLSPTAKLPYCRGCGHSLVVRQLSHALEHLGLPPRSIVLTTDIGCVGLADSLFPYLHTVHTTHGRSTAFATGMALADAILEPQGLKPIVMIGDGGAMIGLLHLVHAAQLNVDITVLVHNNFMFGMTGGQHSALSPLNWVTATTPDGNWTPPLDLLALLRTAHATFLARQLATSQELASTIADAINFPGFSVVEIVELCTAYGTRWNQVNGASLEEIIQRQGYAIGEVETEMERPDLSRSLPSRNGIAPAEARANRRFPASTPHKTGGGSPVGHSRNGGRTRSIRRRVVLPRRARRRALFDAEKRQPGHAGFGILPFGDLPEPQAHRVHGDGKPGRGPGGQ